MTKAVCFNCGELKHGAFTICKGCQVRPTSESDLITSLGLTDNYISEPELEAIGIRLKNGEAIEFDPKQYELLRHEVRAFMKSAMGKAILGKQQDIPAKMWWQFWR